MQCIGQTYKITLGMVSVVDVDVDVDVRQRVNKTFCGRDTRRLGVVVVTANIVVIAITTIFK